MNSNTLRKKKNKQTFSEPFQSFEWFVIVTLVLGEHLDAYSEACQRSNIL